MPRARAVLCALISVVAACGGGGDDDGDDAPLPTGPITARITHYDYRFDLESRLATAIVTATVDVAGDCLDIPFRAEQLEVERTKLDGVVAGSATVENGIATLCGAGYAAGHELAIETAMTIPLATWLASDVGYSVTNDRWGNPMYYLVSWIGGCDRFGPCDNRPDQFATYKFTVTHPADVTVRCPGTIAEVDATTTSCDFAFPGGPTYSTFGVIGSTNFVVSNHDFSGLAVELYDHALSGIEARIDDAFHGGFIDFMRGHFGPFPYGNQLRFLVGPTYWAGFEHPGNIVLADNLAPIPTGGTNYADPLAHIIDHEMAHQWAGDQTTVKDTYDFVWKESMAEYLAYCYEEATDPAAALKTRRVWKAGANGARYYPVPGDDPRPDLLTFYGDVYGPGPLILFKQIEMLSSRDQVLAALESVLGTQRALSVEEVKQALEASTGLDLTDYFAAWVYGAGAPVWPRVTATYAAGTLTVSQSNQASGIKPCKFQVELRGGAGETQRVAVDMFTDGPDQAIPVTPEPPFTVTSTAVDPDAECLVFATTAAFAPGDVPRPYLAPSRAH